MRSALFCAVGLIAASAWADGDGAPANVHIGKMQEIFVDQDQPFVNAGFAHGLSVGQVLAVAGGPAIGKTNDHRDVGTATVAELWENLARLQLDDAAATAKGKKWVRLPEATTPTSPNPSAAASTPPAPAVSPAGKGLEIHAVLSLQRLYLHNDGKLPLHKCELRLPDNRHYYMSDGLAAGDQEAIMLFRFNQDGTPLDRPLDSLKVKCDEGERTIPL
jgi:hypothetical protein